MSGTDKAKNKVEDAKGKGKEAAGRVTGDRHMEREGRRDQTKSDLKDAAEKAKDATRH
jgi:uncharacterized protein YjbJ (UPF0337 family)